MDYPKITLVTPSYNLDTFLEKTILSVLNQNYPNLEYIIIDGGSTDNSVDIIKKYEDKISFWVSESDKGMYHALQKGFEKSTGQIMGWINADDILHSNSLFIVAELLSLPKVEWVQGLPTVVNENGSTVYTRHNRPNLNDLLHKSYQKDFAFIQQESTFWNRTLWEQAGSYISNDFELAGDFELWMRFFRYQNLYNIDALIGAFRIRVQGQKSRDGANNYLKEADAIIEREKKYHIPLPMGRKAKLLSKIKTLIPTFEAKTNSKIHYDFDNQKFILNQ